MFSEQQQRFKPHNTMRFDVSMPYIGCLIDDGIVSRRDLADQISHAIQERIDELIGKYVYEKDRAVAESEMMHYECLTISLD